tara:strand:+ start:574 stop:1140 length:567 start_codon:yes stop_codon:yes gene_type:complete
MTQHTPQVTFSVSEKEVEHCLEYDCKRFLDLKFIGRQINTPAGIVDVLAQSLEDRNIYYVIEIKKGTLDAKALCQALRYSNYFNDNKNKDGQRIFIPLLIGAALSEDLTKVVYHYSREYSQIGRVEYTLFSLSALDGIRFDFTSIAQEKYEKEHLNNTLTRADKMQDGMDCFEHDVAMMMEREGITDV